MPRPCSSASATEFRTADDDSLRVSIVRSLLLTTKGKARGGVRPDSQEGRGGARPDFPLAERTSLSVRAGHPAVRAAGGPAGKELGGRAGRHARLANEVAEDAPTTVLLWLWPVTVATSESQRLGIGKKS